MGPLTVKMSSSQSVGQAGQKLVQLTEQRKACLPQGLSSRLRIKFLRGSAASREAPVKEGQSPSGSHKRCYVRAPDRKSVV